MSLGVNGTCKTLSYSYVEHTCLSKPYVTVSFVDQEHFDRALSYKPNPDDLFVVSYPKSGTTWLLNILYLLRNNGIPLQKGEKIDDTIPYLEFDGIDAVEKLTRPRIIETHLYKCLMPFNDEAKYIFVGE